METKAQVIIDNGQGIHLAVLEDGAPVYLHRFDNIDGSTNDRAQLGTCLVDLITDGFDADEWDGNDLDEFPTAYDELTDAFDPSAEIEL